MSISCNVGAQFIFFKPSLLPTSSRVLTLEEFFRLQMVLSTTADLWHLGMAHLNFQDRCKLKSKATGISFVGKHCFCQACVMAKMRRTSFQSKGKMTVHSKSWPFPQSPTGKLCSLNAICKDTGKRWRAGEKLKSDAAECLTHLII